MDRKAFFQGIESTIKDWKATNFVSNHKTYVPGLDDGNLTYGNGEEKKGVELNTCVLFVDIRNSVALTEKHHIGTMGKIYSVFTQCVLMAADLEGGFVRNIIGDRVMVVFPEENCYTNAVNCAITINCIANKINEIFNNVDFKCGIGIDYGKMNIMKVGMIKKGAENDDNKGLVWVGYPANYASRLTDTANKEVAYDYYHIEGTRLVYRNSQFGMSQLFPETTEVPLQTNLTTDEYLMSIRANTNGRVSISNFHSVTKIQKLQKKHSFPEILMSETVYKGFARANPNRTSVKEELWTVQNADIRDINYPVYGGNIVWTFD